MDAIYLCTFKLVFCKPHMIDKKVLPKIKFLSFTNPDVVSNLKILHLSSVEHKMRNSENCVGLSFTCNHNKLSLKLLTSKKINNNNNK